MKAIHKFWHMYSPLIHAGVWLVMLGWYGQIVYAQSERIDKIDHKIESLEVIKNDVGTMRESIRWIEKALGRI